MNVPCQALSTLQARYPNLKIRRDILGLEQTALRGKFRYQDGALINRNTGQRIGGNGKRRIWRHRLLSRWIWLWHCGWVPELPYVIDHIDNDPLNDRIENLQALHFIENMNKDLPADAPRRAIRTSLARGNNFIFNLSAEARKRAGERGRAAQARAGVGIHSLESHRRAAATQQRLGVGIHSPAARQRSLATRRRNAKQRRAGAA